MPARDVADGSIYTDLTVENMDSSSLVATMVVPAALAACCVVEMRRNQCTSTASPLAESGALPAQPAQPEVSNRAAGPRADTSCAIGIYEAENARNASMLCAMADHVASPVAPASRSHWAPKVRNARVLAGCLQVAVSISAWS